MLPGPVAQQILDGQEVTPVLFKSATICYIDVVGMMKLEEKLPPTGIMQALNDIHRSEDKSIKFKNLLCRS